MKKRLSLFATLILAMIAALTFITPPTSALTPDSCRTQCRVAYDKCNRETSNPGGLNQCKKAYQACLGGCS